MPNYSSPDLSMTRRRTAGDGMESEPITTEPSQRNATNIRPKGLVQVFPTTTIVHRSSGANARSKSPKFVPYEPYKAAVRPIVPKTSKKSNKVTKNNMDINILISQMSQMNTNLNEFKPRAKLTSSSNKCSNENPCPENNEMQKKIYELALENEVLKEQLKQQAQVNKELKTMLVASMGEDLETQMHCLNEDKKHLADALLSSAQHLSTHQEQTEWLAGQCEVWRSKFLASSLMVEELANWKKLLNERTEELRYATRQLLDERCRARDMMLCTHRNLNSLHENWFKDMIATKYGEDRQLYTSLGSVHLNAAIPHSTNILDLASVNLKLSENISSTVDKHDVGGLDAMPSMTEAEKYAENVMSLPLELKKVSDAPVAALVSHAHGGGARALHPPRASCGHCRGTVQLL